MARVQPGLPSLPAQQSHCCPHCCIAAISGFTVELHSLGGDDVPAWLQVFSAAALCRRCEIAGTDTQTNEVDSHET